MMETIKQGWFDVPPFPLQEGLLGLRGEQGELDKREVRLEVRHRFLRQVGKEDMPEGAELAHARLDHACADQLVTAETFYVHGANVLALWGKHKVFQYGVGIVKTNPHVRWRESGSCRRKILIGLIGEYTHLMEKAQVLL